MSRIIITTGGDSHPCEVFTTQELEADVTIVDWDEVNEGVFTYDQLLDMAEDVVPVAPQVAQELREAATKQKIERPEND